MIRKRQFHQSYETYKATLPRGHFLTHHPGVAVAEKKDQAPTCNPIGAKLGSFLNHFGLGDFQVTQGTHRAFEERQACAVRMVGSCLVIHEVLLVRLADGRNPPRQAAGSVAH